MRRIEMTVPHFTNFNLFEKIYRFGFSSASNTSTRDPKEAAASLKENAQLYGFLM